MRGSSLHRVALMSMGCKNGDHALYPFLIVAMSQIVEVGMDVAVVPVDRRRSGRRGVC